MASTYQRTALIAGAVLSVLLASLVFSATAHVPHAVVELNADSFAESVKEGTWFVKFYAPWCTHCQRMAPEWENFAEVAGDYFHIADVDCTKNSALCNSFNIAGYPTIMLFTEGHEPVKYNGQRSIEAMVNFVSQQNEALANLPDLIEQKHGALYAEADEKLEGDEEAADDGIASAITLTAETMNRIYEEEGPWLVLFYAPWCPHCRRLLPTWETLARVHGSSFKVAKIDAETHSTVNREFDVKGFPTIRLFAKGHPDITYKGARSVEALAAFAQENKEKLKPPPENQATMDGAVVVLTANNFEKMTKRGKFFVEFYAPWCTFCKSLKGTWNKLAGAVHGDKESSTFVAKVDCTVQRILAKRFEINSYPTLLLLDKGVVVDQYIGDRSFQSLLDFVHTHEGRSTEAVASE